MFVKCLVGLFYIGKFVHQIGERKLEFDTIRMIHIITCFLNAANDKVSCCLCCIKWGMAI
jgi:hypothetical protein